MSRRRNKDKSSSRNVNINKDVYDQVQAEFDSKPYQEGFKKQLKAKIEPLKALNPKQASYIKYIEGYDVVLAIGSAGTSKSYIPSVMASDALRDKKIDKVIIARPMEGPGRHIGTLPGSIEEKYAAWLAPVLDTFKKRLGAGTVEYMVKKGQIEMLPLCMIKGRSFNDTWCIIDEAEDIDIDTMKSLLTRKGHNSKLLINGDIKQQHIIQKSGLGFITNLIQKYNLPIPMVEFTIEDCVRDDFVKMILGVFEREGL